MPSSIEGPNLLSHSFHQPLQEYRQTARNWRHGTADPLPLTCLSHSPHLPNPTIQVFGKLFNANTRIRLRQKFKNREIRKRKEKSESPKTEKENSIHFKYWELKMYLPKCIIRNSTTPPSLLSLLHSSLLPLKFVITDAYVLFCTPLISFSWQSLRNIPFNT